MTTIACPLCFGPVDVVDDDTVTCAAEGHSFEVEELVRALQTKTDNALWAAIRSLEEQAAFARLRKNEGRPLPVDAAVADEHVERLRDLIRSRTQPSAHMLAEQPAQPR